MKFSYVAIGSDNQKLTGNLEAKSLEIARNQLHKMNLSVIALNKVEAHQADVAANISKSAEPIQSKVKPEAELITYYFVAKDPQGKEVNGTIDANEPYLAYKRLMTDYQFQLIELAPYSADGNHGTSLVRYFENWNQKLAEEGQNIHPQKTAFVKNETEEQKPQMGDEVAAEIDQFISKTKRLLAEHSEGYSKAFLAQIEAMLGNLERIRSSNNLNHIAKVCREIYDLVSNPDLSNADKDEAKKAHYQEMIAELKENSFLGHETLMESTKASGGLKGIRGLFSKIHGQLDQNQALPSVPTTKLPVTPPKRMELLKAYFSLTIERNPILKQAKRQAYEKLLREKEIFKVQQSSLQKASHPVSGPKDFTAMFMEIDSFVGWLLFFYLAYFFVASFSLERNIGLSQALVAKTLSSPFVINVCIFLLFSHLLLTLKIRLFRQNILGSLFLFFLGYGAYALIISNF